MKIIRNALVSLVAGTALVGTAAAFARNLPPSERSVVPNAATPASHLPPTYFGPTYSAAAVYTHIRPQDVTPHKRISAARRVIAVAPDPCSHSQLFLPIRSQFCFNRSKIENE